MAFNDYKVTEKEVQENGVQGVRGNTLSGSVPDNKKVFDRLCTFLINKYNSMVDWLSEKEASLDAATDAVNAATAATEAANNATERANQAADNVYTKDEVYTKAEAGEKFLYKNYGNAGLIKKCVCELKTTVKITAGTEYGISAFDDRVSYPASNSSNDAGQVISVDEKANLCTKDEILFAIVVFKDVTTGVETRQQMQTIKTITQYNGFIIKSIGDIPAICNSSGAYATSLRMYLETYAWTVQ